MEAEENTNGKDNPNHMKNLEEMEINCEEASTCSNDDILLIADVCTIEDPLEEEQKQDLQGKSSDAVIDLTEIDDGLASAALSPEGSSDSVKLKSSEDFVGLPVKHTDKDSDVPAKPTNEDSDITVKSSDENSDDVKPANDDSDVPVTPTGSSVPEESLETGEIAEVSAENLDVEDTLMVLDEWQDEDLVNEDAKKVDISDPDEDEYFLLNMPSSSVVNSCVSKEEYSISVSPLCLSDLSDSKFMKLFNKKSCDDFRVEFVRPQKDGDPFKGFIFMSFSSAADAKKAETVLKSYREGLEIKRKPTESFDIERDIRLWQRKENPRKNSPETILVVKNVASDATIEEMRELFPEARNIILHPFLSTKNKSATTNGIAFILCKSQEAVEKIVAQYAGESPVVRQKQLKLFSYREPVASIPKSRLKLKERFVVLSHKVKVNKKLENAKTNPTAVSKTQLEKELKECKAVIEKDDRTRKSLNLACPSLAELRKMAGLKMLSESQKEKLLKDLHVTSSSSKRQRSRSRERGRSRGRSRSRRRSGSRNRHDDHKKSQSLSKDKTRNDKSKKAVTVKQDKSKVTKKAESSTVSSSSVTSVVHESVAKETVISESTVTTSNAVEGSSEKSMDHTGQPPAKVPRIDQSDVDTPAAQISNTVTTQISSAAAAQINSVVEQESKAQMNMEKQDPVSLLLKLANILSQNMKQDGS